jgi:hypothetical protein
VRRTLFILLLFAAFSFANSSIINSSIEPNSSSNISSVITQLQAKLMVSVPPGVNSSAYLQNHTLLIVGSDIDLSERLTLEATKASNPWLAGVPETNESPAVLDQIGSGRYALVILAGGPLQNNITNAMKERGWLNETNDVEAGYVVEDGRAPDGSLIISISDSRGYRPDLERQSVNYSPLSSFMPHEFVPLAATVISMLLLVLFNLVWNVLAFKAADIGRKGKKVGEGAMVVNGINLTEAVAIVGASVILGLSMSWQYFGLGKGFVPWLAVNSIVCLFAALTHEIAHMLMARVFKIKVEYRFWPFGSLLTLLSSYLGNAFSVQGFLLEEIPEGVEKWKVGLMKLSAPLISAIIMIVFALMNLSSPNPLYKIIYSISGVWAMAEILPFGALDGKDIKDWNRDVWYLAFFFIGGSYFIVTFLI